MGKQTVTESSEASGVTNRGVDDDAMGRAGGQTIEPKKPINDIRSVDALEQMQRLIDIMARLRNPDGGCPWDLEQDFSTIAPYTIEEAYEVAAAIRDGSRADLCEELGELLLQVVFHSHMAQEEGSFGFADVAQGISDKMIRRHPHVFGSDEIKAAGAVAGQWEALKDQERQRKAISDTSSDIGSVSILDGIATGLPALTLSEKLQKRAARVGFDWNNPHAMRAKILEELDEVFQELEPETQPVDQTAVEEEIGDLLFVVANLARQCSVDPEKALSRANVKFQKRFQYIEQNIEKSMGSTIQEASLQDMEALWQEAKTATKNQ